MRLEHEFTLPLALPDAWRLLLDTRRVAPCIPGATVEGVEGDTVVGRVRVKLGVVEAVYQGSAAFIERDETVHRFVVRANSREVRGDGAVTATVTVRLHEAADSKTQVTMSTELDVTGRPAQFGRGVVIALADTQVEEFGTCLSDTLAAVHPTPPDPGTSTMGQWPSLKRLALVLVPTAVLVAAWLLKRRTPCRR
ncbi:MAG TPA: SRPBCC family protein [Pseudonocardiaceae bacterium]|jgi:carbon monoxide dehydrogenase subunit G|nr:SRPBCC family protein [Pseudonocardiaceae bacterium]